MNRRIIFADEQTLFREGVAALLGAQPEWEIVGQTGDGMEALHLVERKTADLLLLDASLPSLNGLDVARELRRRQSSIPIVLFIRCSEIDHATAALRSGVRAVLSKRDDFSDLQRAMRQVCENKVYLSPRIAALVVDDVYWRQAEVSPPRAPSPLTARERQILQLLSEGHSTKAIAQSLSLSPKTVETHRRQLMSKTRADNLAALTRYALRTGVSHL